MFSYETDQQHNNVHESLEIWIKIKVTVHKKGRPPEKAFLLPPTSQQTGLYYSADKELKNGLRLFYIPIGSRENLFSS